MPATAATSGSPPTTVADAVAVLDRLCPPRLAESWDNTGLLLGRRTDPVDRLMTCLTLTGDVAYDAVERGVSLVVTHHPIFFGGINSLTGDTREADGVLQLARAGVAVYSPHTAFDSAPRGINWWLTQQLGLKNVQPLKPDADDASLGSGRIGSLPEPLPLAELGLRLAHAVGVPGLHQVDGRQGRAESVIKVVAVACGAAGSMLDDAIASGAECFVTGEIRFHDALRARSNGISLLIPGHYATERRATVWLAEQLAEQLPAVECGTSEIETDPLRWQPVEGVGRVSKAAE